MTRFLVSVTLVLVLGTSVWSQDTAQQALDKGKERFNAQDYDAAIARFKEAIGSRNGSFAAAHFQLGLAYFYTSKITAAADEFDTAGQQDPENAATQRYIAEIALFDGNYQKALDAYERYLEAMSPRDPDRAEALRRISTLRLMALGTYQAGQTDRDVQFSSIPKPVYPEGAKGNVVGDVVVEAVFTADGQIYGARVVKSLGKEFDEPVLNMVVNLHFKTAIKNGKPVSQKRQFKMHYQKVFG